MLLPLVPPHLHPLRPGDHLTQWVASDPFGAYGTFNRGTVTSAFRIFCWSLYLPVEGKEIWGFLRLHQSIFHAFVEVFFWRNVSDRIRYIIAAHFFLSISSFALARAVDCVSTRLNHLHCFSGFLRASFRNSNNTWYWGCHPRLGAANFSLYLARAFLFIWLCVLSPISALVALVASHCGELHCKGAGRKSQPWVYRRQPLTPLSCFRNSRAVGRSLDVTRSTNTGSMNPTRVPKGLVFNKFHNYHLSRAMVTTARRGRQRAVYGSGNSQCFSMCIGH